MPTNAHFHRAYERHMAGDFKEAEARYRSLLARSPRDANVLHMLGVLCGQTERLDQAINHLNKSIQIESGNAAVHFNLANVLRDTGKLEQAIDAYRKALDLDEAHASAWLNLGLALLDTKKLDEAVTAIETAVKVDPAHHAARHQLALLYFAGDFFEAAREQLLLAIQSAPNVVDYWHNLGSVHRKLGDTDDAIEALEKALTLGPDSVPTLVALAELLHESGRDEQARICVDRVLAREASHEKAKALQTELDTVPAAVS